MQEVQKQPFHKIGLNKPLVFFALCMLAMFGLQWLHDIGLLALPDMLYALLRAALLAFTTLFAASLVLRLTAHPLSNALNSSTDIEHRLIFTRLYITTVYFITAFVILWELGVTLQNLTLLLGFAATGVAFALREVLLSYLVWFMLLTKKPFRIGDYIRVGDDEGRVQHIGTFYVLLDDTPQTRDDFLRIPNKVFLEKNVYNLGRDSVLGVVRIPVSDTTDFPAKMVRVQQAVSRVVACVVFAETVQDKVYVRVEFRSDIDTRRELRSQVTTAALSALSKNTKTARNAKRK